MQNRKKHKNMEISGEHSVDHGQGNEPRPHLSREMQQSMFRALSTAL